MTSAPIYEATRVDELNWLVWDRTKLDLVSVGVDEPVDAPRRSIAAVAGGKLVQRVDIVANAFSAVRYFEVENLERAVLWHRINYPNTRADIWGIFEKCGDGRRRNGISIGRGVMQRRTERIDVDGALVSEAWYSVVDGTLLEMKEYEYGDGKELSATIVYGRNGVLIDRYEED